MDTTALIVVVCVVIPAVIGVGVCLIIYRSRRIRMQKPIDEPDSPEVQIRSRERIVLDTNYSPSRRPPHANQQPIRPTPIREPLPPSYQSSVHQTVPMFSSVRTLPVTPPDSSVVPIRMTSRYSVQPPSYEEIFLTPQNLYSR